MMIAGGGGYLSGPKTERCDMDHFHTSWLIRAPSNFSFPKNPKTTQFSGCLFCINILRTYVLYTPAIHTGSFTHPSIHWSG